jgi:hypothetical protein
MRVALGLIDKLGLMVAPLTKESCQSEIPNLLKGQSKSLDQVLILEAIHLATKPSLRMGIFGLI